MPLLKSASKRGLYYLMAVNRRDVLLAGLPLAAGAAALVGPQQAEAKGASTATLDIAGFGLQPNGKGDQTQALQKAINQAARAGKRLLLPGGLINKMRFQANYLIISFSLLKTTKTLESIEQVTRR